MGILFGAKPGNPGFCHSEGAQRLRNPQSLADSFGAAVRFSLKPQQSPRIHLQVRIRTHVFMVSKDRSS